MFKFLDGWDPILADFKKDIDGVIKGEVRLWTVAMQTYCERLMKLFNDKEKIYLDEEKITLGSCLNDQYFIDTFKEKTGFYDVNSLRRLNNYGNKRKHYTSKDDIEKKEIKEWLKCIHTLSLKTFNYINDDEYYEEFNEKEVEKLLLNAEEEFIDTIEYADKIISRKNEVILNLENEKLELEEFITDDTDEIISYKKSIKKLKKYNSKMNKVVMNYMKLHSLFEDYIDLNRLKNYCVDDIMGIIAKSGYELEETHESLYNELQKLKADIQSLLKEIEKFSSTFIKYNDGSDNVTGEHNIYIAHNRSSGKYEQFEGDYEPNDDEYIHNLYLDDKGAHEESHDDYYANYFEDE